MADTKAEREALANAIAIRLECLRLANAAGALADVMIRAERYEDYILNGAKPAVDTVSSGDTSTPTAAPTV